MSEAEALVHAFALDGRGGAQALDWAGVHGWQPGHGPLWVHLDRSQEESRRWVTTRGEVDPVIVEALFAEDVRPRTFRSGDGLFIVLRGVNLNPGADPEDMVAIRMWIEANRVISVRQRRLMAVQDVRDRFAQGRGPFGPGDILVAVAGRMMERMEPVINDLEEHVDGLDADMLAGDRQTLRRSLADFRREAILLRRYIAPQRDAVARLQFEEVDWLQDVQRARLREVADRTLRYVEDLEAVRDRAAVLQEELVNRMSEEMNRTMYLLTVVATIMLPLGFITGLLGVNVGGIPGAETPYAFAALSAILVVLVAAEVWILRRLRWI